jgi:hypothetical protein
MSRPNVVVIMLRRDSFLSVAALGLFCVAVPRFAYAQAAPGPLPQVQSKDAPPAQVRPAKPLPPPRQSILGEWKLNRDDSDDPREKLQDARAAESQGRGSGGRMGGGYPGGGGRRGGYGGQSESDQDRQRMQELFRPANAVTLGMTGAEVDLTDDASHKRAFMTDGRKLQKSKDPAYEEIAAHWDGSRLVTDEKNALGQKVSRSFELTADGRQLYETVHLTVGRNNTTVVIRYVYDIALQTKQ